MSVATENTDPSALGDRTAASPFFSLVATHNPHQWRLPLDETLCVGPTAFGAMFGGVGLAAGVQAMARTCEQPVVWATAQFISRARAGSVIDLGVTIQAKSRSTTQARAIGRVGDAEIFTVSGALGARDKATSQQWPKLPEVARPDDCAVAGHWRGDAGGMHSQIEVRVAKGHYGFAMGNAPPSPDGRLILWMRPKGHRLIDATMLAILSDHVPAGIGNALGANVAGSSLDNTIRFQREVPTEWVLCDIRIHGVHNGFSHGSMRLFAEDGQLMATASQSAIMRAGERGGEQLGAAPI
jgi:acyl-CoA thioesterase